MDVKRRNYVKALGTLGAFATTTGVTTAQSNQDITGIISKSRVENNDRLRDFYEEPFITFTETTTDVLGGWILDYALNSPSYRVDETLIREGKNGEKQFMPGIDVYLVRFNRDQFEKHLEKAIQNQDSAVQLSNQDVAPQASSIQSADEYKQYLEDLRREAEKEAEKQIQNSLNSRGEA